VDAVSGRGQWRASFDMLERGDNDEVIDLEQAAYLLNRYEQERVIVGFTILVFVLGCFALLWLESIQHAAV
jgi:hypothetical protein